MGGNLLKSRGGEGRRISNQEKEEKEGAAIGRLNKAGIITQGRGLRCCNNKTDHGDIDLVACPTTELWEPEFEKSKNGPKPPYRWFQAFGETIGARPVHLNGKVATYDLDGVQLDISATEPEEYENHLAYKDFSPLGNILGKMIRFATRARWGEQGLFAAVIPDRTKPEQILRHHIFSKDPRKISQLAGLDHDRWQAGFETMDEVYQFLLESRLFHKAAFEPNQLNHAERTRERKRKDFAEWIERNRGYSNQLPSQEAGKAILAEVFPDLERELKGIANDWKEQIASRQSKINAELVQQWTAANGTQLRNLLRGLRTKWNSREEWEEWIDSHTREEIQEQVLREGILPQKRKPTASGAQQVKPC